MPNLFDEADRAGHCGGRVLGLHTQTHPGLPTTTSADVALWAWLRDWSKDYPRRGFRNAYAEACGEGWR